MSHTYFTDRDLGKLFPQILRCAGLSVERHCDVFNPTTPDEQWLAYCGRNGLIAVSHDSRIRYKPNEKAAVQRHEVGLLIVVGKERHEILATNFVNTYRKIEAFVSRNRRPFIGKIYLPSRQHRSQNPNYPGSVKLSWPQRS